MVNNFKKLVRESLDIVESGNKPLMEFSAIRTIDWVKKNVDNFDSVDEIIDALKNKVTNPKLLKDPKAMDYFVKNIFEPVATKAMKNKDQSKEVNESDNPDDWIDIFENLKKGDRLQLAWKGVMSGGPDTPITMVAVRKSYSKKYNVTRWVVVKEGATPTPKKSNKMNTYCLYQRGEGKPITMAHGDMGIMLKYMSKDLGESMDLSEDAMDDAMHDLDNEGIDALNDIAADYNLDPVVVASQYRQWQERGEASRVASKVHQSELDRAEAEMRAVTKANRSAAAKKAAANRAPYYVQSERYYDERVPVTHDDIQELGHYMMGAAGESFPDGDPNNQLMRFFRQKGWDSSNAFEKLVPVAARKVLQTNSYNEYLADMWDDFYGDAKYDAEHPIKNPDGSEYYDTSRLDMLGGANAHNPWR